MVLPTQHNLLTTTAAEQAMIQIPAAELPRHIGAKQSVVDSR